ncbi:hypothetical protein R5R35_009517 [Gryllus longicercus]|uniref:Dehydrogenase/reductase SDR family member 11 n=1 Tax=Gryllus longicercus TaxID=2509291 RepID=A0AAN9VK49_9ORTH
MERWRGRVAVVTGASAGIGAAIAYQLQDAGLNVVALARRKEKIQAAVEAARKQALERGRVSLGKAPSPGELHTLRCDVSNEDDVLAAFKWVKDNLKTVHILVNNAGVGGCTKLDETNTEEWRRLLNINVLGLSICTREAIQLMRASNVDDGHIVHIGSRSGQVIVGLPGLSVYSASKHAVRVLTEGLRKELVAAKSRIRVTEVSPGLTQTDLMTNLDRGRARALKKVDQSGKLQDFWSIPHLNPEDVADVVLYALSTPPHVQIHEIFVMPVGDAF